MNAVCYNCGSAKPEPQRVCGSCSKLPASEEAITQSFMLSTHCMDHEMLEQMGEHIKDGGVMPELPDSIMEPLREEARIFRRLEAELRDARRVDEAVKLQGDGKSDRAYRMLKEVAERTPAAYSSQAEEKLQRFIRFWDDAAYYRFMKWNAGHALNDAKKIVKLPCVYPRAYYWMGQIDYNQRDWTAAETNFLSGKRLEPENPAFKIMLALVYEEQGRLAESLHILEEVTGESAYVDKTNYGEILMMKARFLVELDRFEEGLVVYRSALPYGPDEREAKWFLTYLCIRRSNCLKGESHG